MFNNEIAPLKEGLMPWVGNDPFVLILGTLPGDESIEAGKYYQNPSNRFWSIMYSLFDGDSKEDRRTFITSHHIALWDCFKSARRFGSADKDIVVGSETPNDIIAFLHKYPTIKSIITNGSSKNPKKGYSTVSALKKYFGELLYDKGYNIISLHQTSRSNERYGITFEQKLQEWEIVKQIIEKQL